MGQTATIVVIILFWIISFVEPSGWAVLFRLPERINTAIVICAVLFFLCSPKKRLKISHQLFSWTLIAFIVIPLFVSGSLEGASYLVSFLVVYIVSQGKITEKVIRNTAISIAALGLMVMYVYVHGSLLSGWNDNAISMVGLFSFLYFSIFLILKKEKKIFWIWNIVTILYLDFLFMTDCRSGMLFSVIAVACIVFSSKIRPFLSGSKARLLILNLPLLLAVAVILVASTPYFDVLDRWSIETLEKGIFDGRDTLWEKAFDYLKDSSYLGTGKFMMNYHNSGVAALSVFGIVGYICWIKLFGGSLRQMQYYISDKIVFGALLAFSIIFFQQSLDLGLISPVPNLLPYTILGVGLGRVRYLKGNRS